jgi:hypothetical protein
MEKVIFTKDPKLIFQNVDLQGMPYKYRPLNIFIDMIDIYENVLSVLKLNCPDISCDYTAPSNNWGELKQHVRSAHKKMFCDVCVKFKKSFSHEQRLFTQSLLVKHMTDGDIDDPSFSGHPDCGFCKSRFYTNDELYLHCREKHEQCFLCQADGIQHFYFQNYDKLVHF